VQLAIRITDKIGLLAEMRRQTGAKASKRRRKWNLAEFSHRLRAEWEFRLAIRAGL